MAPSKNILFRTPRGQLLRNTLIIRVTNITERLEYVLLRHNVDVTKPRALNTFQDGLAELEIEGFHQEQNVAKRFNRKRKGYRNNENTFENESNEFIG